MNVDIELHVIDGKTEEEARKLIQEKMNKEPGVWDEKLITKIEKRKEFVAIMASVKNEHDPLLDLSGISLHDS